MSERLLAVFAHPDDESLLTGGTLAACAAGGVEVRVVSMTRGELGAAGKPGTAQLGAVREVELAAAAAALGISSAECLGYPDGELSWLDGPRVVGDLAARIRSWTPRAVITFGPEGLYWHPDHIAVHRLTTAALEAAAAGDASAPAWLYGATWPDDLAARLVTELEARGLPRDLWGLDPGAFGVPRRSITTLVDVGRFLEPKLGALRCHASQFAAGHALAALPPRLARELLGHEYFLSLRAAESGEDWLARTLGAGTPVRAAR